MLILNCMMLMSNRNVLYMSCVCLFLSNNACYQKFTYFKNSSVILKTGQSHLMKSADFCCHGHLAFITERA